MRGLAAVVAVALLNAVMPSPALAAEPEGQPASPDAAPASETEVGEARTHFETGREAFANKRYAEAARSFEAAARLSPHPASLINAGEAWEKAGEAVLAARAFERARTLEQASEQDRSDAIRHIEQLRSEIGVIKLVGTPETRVMIGKETWHGGDRVFIEPGRHLVRLPDVENARAKKVEVSAGGVRSVELDDLIRDSDELAPAPEEPAAPAEAAKPPPAEGGEVSLLTGLMLGTAVVATGAAVYFTMQVVDSRDAFDERPNREEYDRFQERKLLTNVSVGVAVVAAAVGTVLLIGDLDGGDEAKPKTEAQRRPKRLEFGIAPQAAGGAGLFARTKF